MPIIHGYTLNNYALFLQIAIANVIFVFGFQNQICARSGINNGTIIYLRLGPSVKRALKEGYKNFINFVMRHIPAHAFLPPDEIPAAFDELRDNISLEVNGVVRWFEDNYVYGRIRRTSRNGNIIRSPPLFPHDFWSVADNIDNAFPRTQKYNRKMASQMGNCSRPCACKCL